MRRVIVNVATGQYVKGQRRLFQAIDYEFQGWQSIPEDWPSHGKRPYAFKAYALKEAADSGVNTLLWCDACIIPVKPLEPLWDRIERDGYWMSRNGYTNYEWTADSAYPDLFDWPVGGEPNHSLEDMRNLNRTIPHVVATTFGISLKHELGRKFLEEYYRLASQTQVFCGPWTNANYQANPGDMRPLMGERCRPCGPSDVRGHRHDQTAASVIAWRLGFQLTDPPHIFAYKGGETDQTILVADGAY